MDAQGAWDKDVFWILVAMDVVLFVFAAFWL